MRWERNCGRLSVVEAELTWLYVMNVQIKQMNNLLSSRDWQLQVVSGQVRSISPCDRKSETTASMICKQEIDLK